MKIEELDRIVDQFAQDQYREGLMKGLELVDKIINWLEPISPNDVDLADVSKWAKKAREEFKRTYNLEVK